MKQTPSCSDCKYDKAETYHDKMWCRDCGQKDRFKANQLSTNCKIETFKANEK
jgi:hypothetical protein